MALAPSQIERRLVSITITLGAIRATFDGFNKHAVGVPLASNSLDGDRIRSYESPAAAADDVTAGFLASSTYDLILAMFSQDAAPAAVKVFNADLAALTPETYAQAYAAAKADDPDFYAVHTISRTDAHLASLATALEADRRIGIFQSSNAAWKTPSGGVPSGLSALGTRERSAVLFHDTDAQYGAEAWAANRLALPPDRVSAPFKGPAAAFDPYATGLTDTEIGAVLANGANVVGPAFGEPLFVYPGRSVKGRPLYELVSADWYAVRLEEQAGALVVELARQRRKLTVDLPGQSLLLGVCDALGEIGKQLGHFRDYRFTRGALDVGAGTIGVNGAAVLAVDGVSVDFRLNFTTSDLPALAA